MLTSIHWWENYVHEGKSHSVGLPRLARNIKKFRTKLQLYSNVWKLILSLLIPLALFGITCNDGTQCIDALYYTRDGAILNSSLGYVELVTAKTFNKCDNHLPLIVACLGILAGGVSFKLGKVACKIMTQIMDYSLPLVLSTPTALGVLFAMYGGFMTTPAKESCYLPFPIWKQPENAAADYMQLLWDNKDNLFFVGAALIGYLSLLLITNHIWMPGKERLQRTDK